MDRRDVEGVNEDGKKKIEEKKRIQEELRP